MSEQQPNPTIAELNDVFRRTTSHFVVTPGVGELPHLAALLMVVRSYDDFSSDNDPHGEHDFGTLEWEGESVFWKIDYYDQALEYWEDPLSPDCRRVLTVMLASEY